MTEPKPTQALFDQAAFDQALVEESGKKSALVWVSAPGWTVERALWHVWHDGAVTVVGDGSEQSLHGLADGTTVTVTVRSKGTGGRVVGWPAQVVELVPGSEQWRSAVHELAGKRLNAADSGTMTDRWTASSRVLRLEPAGRATERPGAMTDVSHAAPPRPVALTTRRPMPASLPWLLLGRGKKKRGKSE